MNKTQTIQPIESNEIVNTTSLDTFQGDALSVLDESSKISKALMTAVTQNKWAITIPGQPKQFLMCEAWQTLASFFSASARIIKVEPVSIGGVDGFKATAELVSKDGRVIGGAESYCMRDENRWKSQPMYALSSMASTRAIARSIRQVFAWVAVMAGYSPTPYEEMTDVVTSSTARGASDKQLGYIRSLISSKGVKVEDICKEFSVNKLEVLDSNQASEVIKLLTKQS